ELKDGVEHPLKRASKLKREELKHFMMLQIDDLNRTCDLSEAQIARLQVASKGAIERSLEKWVQEIEDNGWLDMVGQMDPDVADQWLANVGENLSHKSAARHELWLKTIESVLTNEQKDKRKGVTRRRQAYQRRATVDQAIAILDLEMMFSEDQRNEFRNLVDEKMGAKLGKRGRAPRQAGTYASTLPIDLVQAILNDAQLARWHDIRERGQGQQGIFGEVMIGGNDIFGWGDFVLEGIDIDLPDPAE
ncbi:MAG: hypothetical protein AAF585_05930, partial [Verrucomicrobiota bacterium]